MARLLSRRGFLSATAGLLATRPSFAVPQIASPEVFAVSFRQAPPHENLRALIQPGADVFECEQRAVEILAALTDAVANQRPLPLAADFKGLSPVPTRWEQLAPDAALAHFDTDNGDFAAGLETWRDERSDFRFYPLEDGIVRFEAQSSDAYHVGHWRLDWREGALHSFTPIDETRARHRPFLPVGIIDPQDPTARQLAVGIPEWRRQIDLTAGIDVYGQNGIAVGDIDNDGFDEIYVCQPGGLPNRLLKRSPDGLYRDISKAAGVDLLDNTSCALFVDFRNSGRQDLVVLSNSQPFFFANQGDVSFKLQDGAFRFAKPAQGSFTGMAAADYDGDGFVDLYLCTYIYFQSEDQYSYPSPYHDAQNGPPNFLFRNRLADGYFEDVTAQVGLDQNNDRYSFAPAWCDYDFDGRPELYVANDFGRNNLYKFDGTRFRDIAAEAGVEDLGPGMSAAWFDAQGSGRPDLYVTNMWSPAGRRVINDPAFTLVAQHGLREQYHRHSKGNTLYRNKGDGSFEETGQAEVGRWAWTGDAFDFDADGTPEIFVASGMVSEPGPAAPDAMSTDLMSFFWRQTVAQSSPDGSFAAKYEEGWNAVNQFIREGYSWNGHEPNTFYKRRGERWIDSSADVGLTPRDTRSFAAVDLTGDGRLDLVLKNRLAPQIQALLNTTESANIIVLELQGTKSNRDAIGSWVVAESSKGTTSQLVSAGSGYLCQHTKRVHLGLGSAEVAEKVTVRWPSGATETIENVASGKRYHIVEGQGITGSVSLSAARPIADVSLSAGPAAADVWLLEPVPLPEQQPGPGLVVINRAAVEDSPDRSAWYALFQRYLLDYRGPLTLPLALLVDDQSRAHKLYRGVPDEPAVRADLVSMQDPDRTKLALPFDGWYASGLPSRNYFRHGAAFYQAGYPDQALPYLDVVLSRTPDNFKAQLAVGQIHLDAERTEAARPHIEAAVRLNAKSPEAWNNYGGLAMQEQSYSLALERFQKAIALAPDSGYAYANAAQAADRAGQDAEAERLLRRALDIDASDADALSQLGLLLARQERFDEAKQLFERAIQLQRDHVAAINNLAVVYLRLNQPNEATAALRYGIRVAPQSEETYMNLARIYVQGGDRLQARAVLEEALNEVPDSSLMRRALEELNRP
ncbi:MAG: FG-GAP-like repeat-containing protein [Acidobacteria bacterium]|nr:FG-GAP-like repeat-containing protein [Acidobacteriota bacterium]MDA1233892.1 FG-GAP-like repeat-containing protein [Acidobacteriota bacterium]